MIRSNCLDCLDRTNVIQTRISWNALHKMLIYLNFANRYTLNDLIMANSLDVEKNDDGDPTTLLFQDKILLGLCGIYGISMVLLLLVI